MASAVFVPNSATDVILSLRSVALSVSSTVEYAVQEPCEREGNEIVLDVKAIIIPRRWRCHTDHCEGAISARESPHSVQLRLKD